MTILVGIDGTGPASDAVYASEFKDTFVSRIIRDSRIEDQNKKYFRGPDILGRGLLKTISSGSSVVVDRYRETENRAVLLAGYSRGGAGAIVIAKALKRQNIPVKAMLLFDAVGRHILVDARAIPNNVARVLHIRRDPRSHSRRSFGSTGTRYEQPTVYEERFFLCTHGGIGGKPWTLGKHSPDDLVRETLPDGRTTITYAEDAGVSGQIWESIQTFIRENEFM